MSARELGNDIRVIKQLQDQYQLPFISTNIINSDTGEPFFLPHLNITSGNKTIFVIGITRPVSKSWNDCNGDTIIIENPFPLLQQKLNSLSYDPDVIVLLANFPLRNIKSLITKLPEIDIVLGGDGYSLTREPLYVNGTIICYGGRDGRKLPQILLHFNGDNYQASQIIHDVSSGIQRASKTDEFVNKCMKRALDVHIKSE